MKTIIKIFICLSLIYTPMFANAAKLGGWNLSNPVAQGASTIYDATKNVLINGKDFVKKSTVKITPNATQVAKVLRGGVAGYALSVAVEQLLGAVDWVMDADNNQILYTNSEPIVVNQGFVYDKVFYASSSSFCSAHVAAKKAQTTFPNWVNATCTVTTVNGVQQVKSSIEAQDKNGITQIVFSATSSWVVVTEKDEEEKSIPLETVAAQVISNAESDTDRRAAAQVATTAAAADIVAEAETDNTKARPIANQAEANAETKPADADVAASANTGTATATPQADPVTGEQAPPTDIALQFPVFCNWAPTICEAAQVVISFPNTLTGWYNDTKTKSEEWATAITDAYHDFMNDDELPNDDTKVDITELPVPELKEDAISWGASCPADVSIPISMQGVSSTLVFSWSPWCQLLSIIKPAIIASAYIGAAFIVLGLRT